MRKKFIIIIRETITRYHESTNYTILRNLVSHATHRLILLALINLIGVVLTAFIDDGGDAEDISSVVAYWH